MKKILDLGFSPVVTKENLTTRISFEETRELRESTRVAREGTRSYFDEEDGSGEIPPATRPAREGEYESATEVATYTLNAFQPSRYINVTTRMSRNVGGELVWEENNSGD